MDIFKLRRISLSFLTLICFIVILGCGNSDSPDEYYTITLHKNDGSEEIVTQRVLANTKFALMANKFEREIGRAHV